MLELTESVRTAGPLVLSPLLGAYRGGGDEDLGRRLVAATRESRGLTGLRADVNEPGLGRLSASPYDAKGNNSWRPWKWIRSSRRHAWRICWRLWTKGTVRQGQAVFKQQSAPPVPRATLSATRGGRSGPRPHPDRRRPVPARSAGVHPVSQRQLRARLTSPWWW